MDPGLGGHARSVVQDAKTGPGQASACTPKMLDGEEGSGCSASRGLLCRLSVECRALGPVRPDPALGSPDLGPSG